MARHSHGAEGNHLPDHFVDNDTLGVMSPEGLDALSCKNARKKKEKYSMHKPGAHARRIHNQIKENADGRAGGSGRFWQKSGAACCGDPGGDAVSRRLRVSHSAVGECLQPASPRWGFGTRRLPSGPGRSFCSVRCKRGERDFRRRRFPSGKLGTSCVEEKGKLDEFEIGRIPHFKLKLDSPI